MTERLHFHALEKEMSIPGMAEPGGLPSMVSHRLISNLAADRKAEMVGLL